MADKNPRWIADEFNFDYDLDEEDLRIWANDEDLLLCQQDEDLFLIHSEEFYPVFLKLAFNEDCSKKEYIKNALDYGIVCTFSHGRGSAEELETRAVKKIDHILSLLTDYPAADSWKLRLHELRRLATKPNYPVDENTAVHITRFIMEPHISEDSDVKVGLTDTKYIYTWRGQRPSWGICFERATGRMMSNYTY